MAGFSYIACSLAGLPQLMDVPNLLRSFGLLLMGVRRNFAFGVLGLERPSSCPNVHWLKNMSYVFPCWF